MTENQVPFSNVFQDVYFSREDGLAESEHVFLAGNDLPFRWSDTDTFTVAETGFGTGLNFLATWRTWNRLATTGWLHYTSVEKHPLNREELSQAHNLFPDLGEYSEALLTRIGEPLPGFHRYRFENARITLTLCHGDVVDMLRQLSARVDCWFLDGFAPAKNPGMWSEQVFREVARLSNVGTTFATFTVAGDVRRGLKAQGFRVEKRPGFGRKREMCAGVMTEVPAYRVREPWFRSPVLTTQNPAALVIGAGIAGAQVANHLAERGWQVEVLERHDEPGLEASGNPAAVLSPFVAAEPCLEDQFSLQAFHYTLQQLDHLDPERRFHRRCGVLALSMDTEYRTRAERINQRGLPKDLVRPVAAQEANALCGLETGLDGLFYPQAGWIRPADWIQSLLTHCNIRLRTGTDVADFCRHQDGRWVAMDAAGSCIASAPVLVIASGRSMHWPQCRWIPTTPVSGQTTYVDNALVHGMPLCVTRHRGYLVPLGNDQPYLIGSTYRRGDVHGVADEAADQHNWETFAADLPAVANTTGLSNTDISSAHAAVRMTSENRLPIVGALPDPERLRDQYQAMLRRGYQTPVEQPVYPPGLYLSAAWGSRGMTNAALGGELLASLINNEPLPLQQSICHALHPARSLVRQLKQGVQAARD